MVQKKTYYGSEKQETKELRKHLLRCIIARRDSKDITIKRHIHSFLHFPDIDAGLSSITQHCWTQTKSQNNNSKSCRRRRRRKRAHLWSYLQCHDPLTSHGIYKSPNGNWKINIRLFISQWRIFRLYTNIQIRSY